MHQKGAHKRRNGFSLMELLVYVVVLSVVGLVVGGTIVSLIQGGGRIEARGEVASNIRFVAEKIKQDLKNATNIYSPSAQSSSTTLDIDTLVTTTASSNPFIKNAYAECIGTFRLFCIQGGGLGGGGGGDGGGSTPQSGPATNTERVTYGLNSSTGAIERTVDSVVERLTSDSVVVSAVSFEWVQSINPITRRAVVSIRTILSVRYDTDVVANQYSEAKTMTFPLGSMFGIYVGGPQTAPPPAPPGLPPPPPAFRPPGGGIIETNPDLPGGGLFEI
ncbi:MAG: prepilin-type N-terminal cleavage/methylation domain-containing protein [Candidatus Colwellbacteria bacterium]|nr:prepilin-type N-terminal cleavage/methylation domain-containing protein [Candidatus Colwellbacteria bacterium]